ncbi:ionotropic glutamate receptor [Culex quinquefasciatus]|uniref:Ionotropic glutamate receptor n=1 Tax=Culex quinquefasciatus TaxID=7176 RepID=B0W960_CULQU|nr:ionotropic glutamate receptor [Culex quinquefasciatus]|eukprot:XP_001845244.1 ionotropic glutamate receptor [Culex quinquefasciatus]
MQIVNISGEVSHLDKMSSIRHDLGLVVDASCDQTENLFNVMSRNSFFNASYEWLIFSRNTFNSSIRLLRRQNLNVDSRVVLAEETSSEDFMLFDVYNTLFRRNGKFHVTLAGRWNEERGFSIDCRQSLYDRRHDFQNVAMYVVFTDLKRKHNRTILERLETNEPLQDFALWRFSHHYVQMLMMKHNFRVQYITTPGWGSQSTMAHKTSTGLLGQLKLRQVDLAVNTLYVYQDRIAIVDYSVVVAMHNCRFVFRHPRRSNTRITFLQPFDNSAWLGLFTGLTVAGVALFCAFRLERKFPWNISRTSQEYLLTILGFICLQGFAGITFLNASKVIIVVMLSCALLIYQYYSSFIIGSLLTSPPRYLNTIRQLISSDLEVTIENLFYLWEFYNRTTSPEVEELFQKKILTGSESSTDVITGIQKIKKGGYAMQCDIGYAYPIIKRTFTDDEICDLQEIEVYSKKPLHLPLPKGSPLKQFFRVTLRKLIESGSGPYYEREFFSQKPACPRDSLEQVAQIEVVQVVHVFYILAMAMVVCLILLVVEQIYYRFHQRRERVAPYMS